MGKFKRVSLEGSEELFRPTSRPKQPTVEETEDTITEMVDREPTEPRLRSFHLTIDEVDLLLEAIQIAKYPERAKAKLPLYKHERFDEIRAKLQRGRGSGT
jgi:hypothetical protein